MMKYTVKTDYVAHGGLEDARKDWEKDLPENKFLVEFNFVNEDLELVNEDGHLVDSQGKLINKDGRYVDKEGNKGLTAIVMIETSHIAFHIWDESDPSLLQFDLYTCGSLDLPLVFDEFHKAFDVISLEYQMFDRENGFVVEESGKLPF
jgi:hypothetical protein